MGVVANIANGSFRPDRLTADYWVRPLMQEAVPMEVTSSNVKEEPSLPPAVGLDAVLVVSSDSESSDSSSGASSSSDGSSAGCIAFALAAAGLHDPFEAFSGGGMPNLSCGKLGTGNFRKQAHKAESWSACRNCARIAAAAV